LQKNNWANHVRSELHKRNAIQPLDGRVKKISEGFKGRILHYMYVKDGTDLILPENFLSEAGLSLLPHLSILLESYTSAKVNFELIAENILFKDESEEIEMKSFQSKVTIMNKDSDLENIFHEHTMAII